MKNLTLILISILDIVTAASYKAPETQKFIQIEYTGISESSGRWLFIATKMVDTTTIESSLSDLKIKVDSQSAIHNRMSMIQLKMLMWHGLFNVIITDDKTFSEAARFIEKNKERYDSERHSDYLVIVNGARYPIGLKHQKRFFGMLVKNLADGNCDTAVIKNLQRFMFQHYLND